MGREVRERERGRKRRRSRLSRHAVRLDARLDAPDESVNVQSSTLVADMETETHPLLHEKPIGKLVARILEEGITPSGEKIFGLLVGQWALMHDRDPNGMFDQFLLDRMELGITVWDNRSPRRLATQLKAREHSSRWTS